MKIIYTDVLAALAEFRQAAQPVWQAFAWQLLCSVAARTPLSCPSALRSALTLKRLRAACRPPSAT